MSFHFDKSKASDFGLIEKTRIRQLTRLTIQFGKSALCMISAGGTETGFCKQPIPKFDYLMNLSLDSTDRDDKYGAAAVILKKYPNKLLNRCEKHYGKSY